MFRRSTPNKLAPTSLKKALNHVVKEIEKEKEKKPQRLTSRWEKAGNTQTYDTHQPGTRVLSSQPYNLSARVRKERK